MFKKKKEKKEKLTAEQAVELLKEKSDKQEAEIEKLKSQLAEKEEQEEEQPKKPVIKKKSKLKFVISEVPTQTQPVIMNKNTGEVFTELTMLCKLANEINEIKKVLKGD
jgi:hypothetical protein